MDIEAFDLFSKMSRIDPSERICFKKAYFHNFFDGVREEFEYLYGCCV